ncbi:MAG: YihY/virulence factor BrkB family protein [Pirellulaceae bacterium]|nr:YihY/virulence factor BrkB family protein [Pirellulaceae bacterium]
MKQFLTTVREAFTLWEQSRSATMGAALAYYTLFSIPPLLVIALAAASLVFGQEAATGQMAAELEKIFGEDVAAAMQSTVRNDQQTGGGPLAMVIGVAVLLFGASGVFGELQTSLNTIWQVQPKPGRGVLGIIKDRFLSFTLVLGTCFLLLVSLVLSTALSVVAAWWTPESVPGGTYLWQGIHAVVGFGVVTLLFAFIYRFLPDANIRWSEVWVGSAVTALLFLAGKQILGIYLAQKGVTSSYGAAGSLVLMLIWVYYTAQVFLFGASFTRVYALHHGGRGEPMENAVPLTSPSPCFPTPAKQSGN